jgi:hypothetical protein
MLSNKSRYSDAQIRKLVKFVCEDMEIPVPPDTLWIEVRTKNGRKEADYTPTWGRIRIWLPKEPDFSRWYAPYERSREMGKSFELNGWKEFFVSSLAHELMHWKQDRREGKRRFKEVEADLQAYRTWKRFTGK